MTDLLIGGSAVPSAGSETIDVLDPATGELVGTVPVGCAADADAAVAAAVKAAPDWARMPAAERSSRLKAAARRLRERAEELAVLQTREGGKPIGDSRGGVEAGIGAIEQYAELGPLHRGRSLQGSPDATDLMVFEPRGVAVVLMPWNDPVAISAQHLAANLAVGNVVVFKPSERTPLSGHLLAEILAAELPPGVLNVVHGDARGGRPLAAHPDVDVVVHVGSVATGREIAAACARTGAKALLELGGKDPLLVDGDVDPAWAAAQAALGAFANSGQICTSVERIYVHAHAAAAFLAALVREAGARVLGSGLDPATTMGPLVDHRQREVVHAHVTEAVQQGASLLCGGSVPAGPGAFYPPTVLTGCTQDMAVMHEETFGPVAAVTVVDSFEEGLRLADAGDYGLAATVLTRDAAHAQQAVRTLRVGTVKVNAVFGGAPGGAATPQRASGTGYGYGPELLDELTFTKVVHLGLAPALP